MSGNKQHFLPRFLQKGFASKYVSRKKVQVWYFEKGKSPEERNTKDVGLEDLFYGEPGTDSLDDLITEKEDRFAKKIDRLRKEKRVCSDDVQNIAEFVYAVALRTKRTRENITSMASSMMSEAQTNLANPNYITDLARELARPGNPLFHQKLKEGIKKKKPGANRRHRRYLGKCLGKPVVTKLRREAPSIGKEEARKYKFIRLESLAGPVSKEVHDKALMDAHSDEPEQGAFMKELIKMNWTVECLSQDSLILGDVAVLQINHDSSIDQPIFGDGKRVGVILPIGNHLLLFGSKKQKTLLPSVEEINRSSAELSLHFFISHRRSEQEMVYFRHLAQRAPQRDKKN